MQLQNAIQGFTLSLAADRYSPRTIEAYRAHLSHLSQYLGNPEVAKITDLDLRRYFAHLGADYRPKRMNGDTSPLAGSSINKIWIAVRSFFRWATVEFKLRKRPDDAIKQPEYTTKAIVPFAQTEITRLLKSCERIDTRPSDKRPSFATRPHMAGRNQAIVLLLLDTGLRVSELCRLLVKDVNLETGEINVTAYGSGRKTKARTVYIGKAARRSIWRYIAETQAPPASPLILSNQRQAMTRNAIRCLLADLGKRAKVANCHPHKFRHTFAIQYLRNGGDVFTLQRLLGHSSLEMVRHYLALANSDAATAHQSASPADRWGL